VIGDQNARVPATVVGDPSPQTSSNDSTRQHGQATVPNRTTRVRMLTRRTRRVLTVAAWSIHVWRAICSLRPRSAVGAGRVVRGCLRAKGRRTVAADGARLIADHRQYEPRRMAHHDGDGLHDELHIRQSERESTYLHVEGYAQRIRNVVASGHLPQPGQSRPRVCTSGRYGRSTSFPEARSGGVRPDSCGRAARRRAGATRRGRSGAGRDRAR